MKIAHESTAESPARSGTLLPCRFRRSKAHDVLTSVLKQKLSGVTYHADNTSTWVREIADEVKARLKGV